jgi:hypothetical protein
MGHPSLTAPRVNKAARAANANPDPIRSVPVLSGPGRERERGYRSSLLRCCSSWPLSPLRPWLVRAAFCAAARRRWRRCCDDEGLEQANEDIGKAEDAASRSPLPKDRPKACMTTGAATGPHHPGGRRRRAEGEKTPPSCGVNDRRVSESRPGGATGFLLPALAPANDRICLVHDHTLLVHCRIRLVPNGIRLLVHAGVRLVRAVASVSYPFATVLYAMVSVGWRSCPPRTQWCPPRTRSQPPRTGRCPSRTRQCTLVAPAFQIRQPAAVLGPGAGPVTDCARFLVRGRARPASVRPWLSRAARSPAALGSRDPLAAARSLSTPAALELRAPLPGDGWIPHSRKSRPHSPPTCPGAGGPGKKAAAFSFLCGGDRARKGWSAADEGSRQDAGRGNGFRLSSPARREPPCRGTREVGGMLWIDSSCR